jgi:DNA-binding Lrp family transcriptional regulator
MNISKLSCPANRVLLALTINGPMTYTELMRTLNLSESSVKRAIRELRSQDIVQTASTGNRRTVKFKATLNINPIAEDVRTMCLTADETEDDEQKIHAVIAALYDVYPKEKFPDRVYHPRDARDLLNLTNGSSTLVYDGIEPARDMDDIKSPLHYSKRMLQTGKATQYRDRSDQAKVQESSKPAYKQYDEIVITDELRAMVIEGGKRFGGPPS